MKLVVWTVTVVACGALEKPKELPPEEKTEPPLPPVLSNPPAKPPFWNPPNPGKKLEPPKLVKVELWMLLESEELLAELDCEPEEEDEVFEEEPSADPILAKQIPFQKELPDLQV